MAFDLMIQSRQPLSPEQEAALGSALSTDPDLAQCEVSVSATVDEFDIEELEEFLDEDPKKRAQFYAFCKKAGIDPQSDKAATEFLSREFGYTHAVVKLPADELDAVRCFAALRKIVAGRPVHLHDPQAGQDLPVNYSSPLPPGW